MEQVWSRLRGGLVVSCQALPGEPLFGAHIMAVMAQAAAQGGAAGIRANSPADIRAIRAAVALPIIGLYKREYDGVDVYITPSPEEALAVAEAGADIIALDATARPHPGGLTAADLIRRVKAETGRPVMADISTLAEGLAAADAGADLISTALSGYTPDSPSQEGPDFALVTSLAATLRTPIVAEGRIWTPAEAREALAAGAFAVVVGTAITRPREITQRFVDGVRGSL